MKRSLDKSTHEHRGTFLSPWSTSASCVFLMDLQGILASANIPLKEINEQIQDLSGAAYRFFHS